MNFVLPEDDLLFDEDDLDACQVAQQPDGIEFTDSIETTTDTTSTYDDYPEADTQVYFKSRPPKKCILAVHTLSRSDGWDGDGQNSAN